MLVLLALLACASDPQPDPCEDMCAVAAAVQCGCIDSWGADWPDVGFEDQQDYFQACQTWAWEMRLLEDDAVDRGALDAPGAVDSLCRDRAQTLEKGDLGCAQFSALDWDEVPW
jgi:hypothetical protein